MSVICKKCGADISFEAEEHPNCETVQRLAQSHRLLLSLFCKSIPDGLYETVDNARGIDADLLALCEGKEREILPDQLEQD